MRKLLLLALLAGLLVYATAPQWQSFDRMGARRFQALSHLPKEILVGVCWPFAANQDGMADGLQLARDEINAGGLAKGIPVRLVLRDDNFDWETAKRIAVEFSDTPKMSAVLGYYDDSEAIKASAMYESSRLLHLMVGVNNTAMTSHEGQYIVRTILSSDKIARALAKLTVKRKHRKIAVIWEEGGFGEDLAYQYRVALDALGSVDAGDAPDASHAVDAPHAVDTADALASVDTPDAPHPPAAEHASDVQIVYPGSYARERADFRLPVNELKGVGADIIFFAGLEPWAGDFVRMARGVGLKTGILGAFSDTPLMRERAGPGIEGAMFFDFYDVNSPSPENQEFVRKFRARYKRDPDTWAAQGYDALRILAKAVRTTGSANPLDLSYAIRFMDPWEGANGLYKFDERGELDDKRFFIDIYRNGVAVPIYETAPTPVPLIR
jgi:branched-chain amino acid transport system substrate-binding protein